MFGSNTINIDWTHISVIVVAVLVLFLQLWLCRRANNLFLKLIPIILLAISTIVFAIWSDRVGGWDAFGLMFFAVFSFALIFVCGLGWAIWAIRRKRNA